MEKQVAPDATGLNRVLTLFKWLLAIPHYVMLSVLGVAVVVEAIVSWIAILVVGRQPRWAFDFLGGGHALGMEHRGVRLSAHHRPLSAVRFRFVTPASRGAAPPRFGPGSLGLWLTVVNDQTSPAVVPPSFLESTRQ